jgi:hypothetical protein
LTTDKRHGGLWSLQHAVWAALLLAAAGWPGFLAGCSGIAASNEELPAPAPDPSYRELVAKHLKAVFKNYSSYEAFEISDPRWVHSMKGWNWLTCVRFQDRGRLRTYSVFLDNSNKVVDDRYAVQTDNCDIQTYYPFGGLYGGLAPLH